MLTFYPEFKDVVRFIGKSAAGSAAAIDFPCIFVGSELAIES
jgi:hypothetical protein